MKDLTIMDMAQTLGISYPAVIKRLAKKGIKPVYEGQTGYYSKSALEAIRNGGKRGRPKTSEKQSRNPLARWFSSK